MCGACRMHGSDEKRSQFFFPLEGLKERDHSENLSADGKVILQRILSEMR